MILSGSTVRTENVQLLASMLDGDKLAAKLERALTNGDTIVAISLADRQRVVTVLGDDAPGGLAQFRACWSSSLCSTTNAKEVCGKRNMTSASGATANAELVNSNRRPAVRLGLRSRPSASPPGIPLPRPQGRLPPLTLKYS